MSKAKYTPGSWKVAEVEGKRMTCVYTDETNIALLVHQEDAKLIALAPEMLQLLKYIRDWFEGETFQYSEEVEQIIARVEEVK